MTDHTEISITVVQPDGSTYRRSWRIPQGDADDLAPTLTAAYGPPTQLLASAEAGERIRAFDMPGVVEL
jgi:hypothetical protein